VGLGPILLTLGSDNQVRTSRSGGLAVALSVGMVHQAVDRGGPDPECPFAVSMAGLRISERRS
jgi:hypothetical protein